MVSALVLPLVAFAILLVMLVVRIPVGVAMLLVGIGGYVGLSGFEPVLNYMKTAAFWRYNSYDFSVIPMFLLMGQFASRSGLSAALFDAANTFLGHRRGGVAMAAVGQQGRAGKPRISALTGDQCAALPAPQRRAAIDRKVVQRRVPIKAGKETAQMLGVTALALQAHPGGAGTGTDV